MKKHGNAGEDRDIQMSMIKKDCDYYGKEYPAELQQYLNMKERKDG